jgi:hypothetical protein
MTAESLVRNLMAADMESRTVIVLRLFSGEKIYTALGDEVCLLISGRIKEMPVWSIWFC